MKMLLEDAQAIERIYDMNKQRKAEIKKQIGYLNNVIVGVNKILDDENDYFENIPENLQTSLRADASEEAIDQLTEAIDNLNEALECLTSI